MLNRNPFDHDAGAPERAQEERGLRLLHRARDLQGLTPQQVRRIAARLDDVGVPARRRTFVPVLAALALLFSAGTAVAWGTGTLQRLPVVRALFTSKRIAVRAPSLASARVRPQPSAPAAPPDSKPAPPPAEPERLDASRPAAREPSLATARKRAAVTPARPAVLEQPVAPVPAPESPIAHEGESFANVLRRWRRDRDAGAALSALDVHDRSFTTGQMELESRLLRVEILLAEGRDREALGVLDRLALGKGNVPRGRELLTVRGELRIKAGRCDDGRADLTSIAGGTDTFAGRARNALTYCR